MNADKGGEPTRAVWMCAECEKHIEQPEKPMVCPFCGSDGADVFLLVADESDDAWIEPTNSEQSGKESVVPKVTCCRCGAEHEFSATEIQMMLQTEAQLRAENERLKKESAHWKVVADYHRKFIEHFPCSVCQHMFPESLLSEKTCGQCRADLLQSQLAAERKKREQAEAKVEQLRMVVVKWQGCCSSSHQVEDTDECIAGWNRRVEQAERERDEARDKAAALESSNDEWASDCRAISEACGLPFLDANGDHSDGNAQEVIDYLDTLKARVAELESRLRQIQQINASTDGGPIIMEGRRGMISDIARQALGEKEPHIAPPAESAHTSIKEKTE